MASGCWFPDRRLIVLRGRTGVGKTERLHALRARGEQVLDLEALACHRGSAFGGIRMGSQPSNREFVDRLAQAWNATLPTAPLYVELEGPHLGSVRIPEEVHDRIARAPYVKLYDSLEGRIDRLTALYASAPVEALVQATRRIAPRLQSGRAAQVERALAAGDLRRAVATVLPYYDRAYAHQQRHAGR